MPQIELNYLSPNGYDFLFCFPEEIVNGMKECLIKIIVPATSTTHEKHELVEKFTYSYTIELERVYHQAIVLADRHYFDFC